MFAGAKKLYLIFLKSAKISIQEKNKANSGLETAEIQSTTTFVPTMNCAALEPPPTTFYAPAGMFTSQDLQQLSTKWLGDTITSPGGSFRYQVTSGPLCRLYWGRGKAEPDTIESAYCQDERGRWRRSHSNYLSYQVEGGSFVTVRWQAPIQETANSKVIISKLAA